ncbi:hypothetical protein FRB95_006970 [Tulasnella sp. JGI-2019a]|nr:hypothetical protein FRB95_006970 [Tulasnella sp. JGI-2019a]
MLNSIQEKLVSLDRSPEAGEYILYRDVDEDIGNVALYLGRPQESTENRVAAQPAKNLYKPWSLLDDLTRLSVEPQPPTSYLVSLIQTLGGDACQAKRNALQLYRIVRRARDICDMINELIILVQISEVEEIVVQAACQYAEMVDYLEKKVERYVTEQESESPSVRSICTWQTNRALYQATLRELYSTPFEPEGEPSNGLRRDWGYATEIDDFNWLSWLCREVALSDFPGTSVWPNACVLKDKPLKLELSLRSCSESKASALGLWHASNTVNLTSKGKESVVHLAIHCAMMMFAMQDAMLSDRMAWAEADRMLDQVQAFMDSQPSAPPFPSLLHDLYDLESQLKNNIQERYDPTQEHNAASQSQGTDAPSSDYLSHSSARRKSLSPAETDVVLSGGEPSGDSPASVEVDLVADQQMLDLESDGGLDVRRLDDRTLLLDPRPFSSSGMSDIYRGMWTPSGPAESIVVTAKVVRLPSADPSQPDDRLDERLARGLCVWQRLNHKRITPLFGYMSSKNTLKDGRPLIVTPYYRNRDLRHYVNENPTVDKLALLLQAADGLRYMHTLGIAHLDVNPGNILITDEGEALFNGLSAAKLFGDIGTGLTTGNAFTVTFTSPELLLGDRGATASDVYSFGGVILEILSGKAPLYRHGNSAFKLIRAIATGKTSSREDHPIPLLPDLALDVLWQLLGRCWASDPGHRPLMTDVIEQLQQIEWICSGPKRTPPMEPVSISKDIILSDSKTLFSTSIVGSTAVTSLSTDALDHDVVYTSEASKALDVTKSTSMVTSKVAAQGGFYAIYQGQFTDMVRGKIPVALRYPLAKKETKVLSERFWKEIEVWSDLDHAHIAKFLGTFRYREKPSITTETQVEGETPQEKPEQPFDFYMVSPWMQHGSIADCIRRDRPFDHLRVLRGIAEAVSYLHQKNYIHGDLKMENVLLSDGGEPLLTDFGLVRRVDSVIEPTSTGVAGTLRWLAPEAVKGAPKSTETDIYAFGMMIVEVLTRRPPFWKIKGAKALMDAVTGNARPEVGDIDTDRAQPSSKQLWELAEKCWLESPDFRPPAWSIVRTLDMNNPNRNRESSPGFDGDSDS